MNNNHCATLLYRFLYLTLNYPSWRRHVYPGDATSIRMTLGTPGEVQRDRWSYLTLVHDAMMPWRRSDAHIDISTPTTTCWCPCRRANVPWWGGVSRWPYLPTPTIHDAYGNIHNIDIWWQYHVHLNWPILNMPRPSRRRHVHPDDATSIPATPRPSRRRHVHFGYSADLWKCCRLSDHPATVLITLPPFWSRCRPSDDAMALPTSPRLSRAYCRTPGSTVILQNVLSTSRAYCRPSECTVNF